MRILQVCPYDIDRPGGVQRHILDTAAAMAELGHQTAILAPRTRTPPLQTVREGIHILRLGRARMVGVGGTRFEMSLATGGDRRRLDAFLRDNPFDIAHFHTPWTPFLALQVLRRIRCPALATFHDTPANGPSGRLLNIFLRLVGRVLLPRFAVLITPSQSPQANLATSRTIEIVPPCTDLARFCRAAAKDLGDGGVKIVFVGRLEKRKGVDILLRAFRGMEEAGLPARLFLVGDGPLAAELKAYVAHHGLAHVTFVGAPDDPAPWLAAADIVCAPSPHGESFGIVIAEAMASGKPVVAAANEGYKTLLTGEAAQFLVPPGDAEALRNALSRLVADGALRRHLGEWGAREAMAYDCRSWAPRLLELYRRAITDCALKVRNAT